ncbi:hypothetical protein [Brevundimonas sp.]|uniref:hypothetical protein n=1 Tax=Brevundimonas sp. TaxID=1871086 RepID=UPI0037BF6D24
MSDDDRVAVLERRVDFMNGQIQALAALLALRVGSHKLTDETGGAEGGQVLAAWELVVGLHQLEGLRAFVDANRHTDLNEGLKGVLALLEVSVQEALDQTKLDDEPGAGAPSMS